MLLPVACQQQRQLAASYGTLLIVNICICDPEGVTDSFV